MDLHERGRPPLFHQVWLWAIQKLASDGFCFLTEVKGRSSAEGEERGQGLEKNEGFEELSWSKAEPSDKKKKMFSLEKNNSRHARQHMGLGECARVRLLRRCCHWYQLS